MFDALIREAAARFGLKDQGAAVLGALLEYMFRTRSLAGILDQVRQAGLGGLVSNWIGGGHNLLAINSTQFESALGRGLTDSVAKSTGIARGPVSAALAFMLPRIVHGVVHHGAIPSGIPDGVLPYLPAQAAAVAAPAAAAAAHVPPAPTVRATGFPWWWIVVPLLGLLAWCAVRKPAPPPEPKPAEAPAPAPAPAAKAPEPPPAAAPAPAPEAPKTNAKLSLQLQDGKLVCSGSVADAAARDGILEALKATFGADANCEIGIDPTAAPVKWGAKLAALLPLLKAPGARLGFDGDAVTLGGTMQQADIDASMAQLKSGLGDGFDIKSEAQVQAAPAPAAATEPAKQEEPAAKEKEANDKAGVALDKVASGGGDNQALVDALNLSIVHFATGKSIISPHSLAILKKAAAAIKAAPAGTRIEVGGHTDNVGKSDDNMKLSAARAQAVRATLQKLGVKAGVLTAKGYGDTKPKASNDTPDGRAQNRRIEYSLQ